MSDQLIESVYNILDKKHTNKYKCRNYTRHARHLKDKYGKTNEEIMEIEQHHLARYDSYCLAKATSKARIRRGATYSFDIVALK